MTDQRDEWLTIRQAATRLDVSELTIRRRIKDGTFPHRLANGKYLVRVQPRVEPRPIANEEDTPIDQADQPPSQPSGASTDRSLAEADQRVIRVDSLLHDYSRAVERAGQATLLERQVQELQAENASLQETLLGLAGRNGWLESRLDERESELKLLTDERHRPPWWKRLFG